MSDVGLIRAAADALVARKDAVLGGDRLDNRIHVRDAFEVIPLLCAGTNIDGMELTRFCRGMGRVGCEMLTFADVSVEEAFVGVALEAFLVGHQMGVTQKVRA